MQFLIKGMDCSSCAGKVETALLRLPGVDSARVNFTSEKLTVNLQPNSQTQKQHIEQAVTALGYQITAVTGAELFKPSEPEQAWWQSKKGQLVCGLAAMLLSAGLMMWLAPDYAGWAFTACVLLGVVPFCKQSIALWRAGSPFSIELLVSIAAIGALFIGEVQEAAAVVFLFSLGELLEQIAANRARIGIKALTSLIPKTAFLLDEKDKITEVHAGSLTVGQRVLVRPGDLVPADGNIVQGTSHFDDSPITGESIPKFKTVDDFVYAGTVNLDGVIQVKVTQVPTDTTIARIIQLVEDAQATKAPTARFVERFSRYYTPAIMLVALLVALIPPVFAGEDWLTWVYRSLALLLIACPCALVLSTPAAIASGLAAGTRLGLLVKGGHALETIGRVTTVAFDKSGTLTEGVPRVTDVVAFAEETETNVLSLAASLELGSSHPLAKSIISHAKAQQLDIPLAENGSVSAGRSVQGRVNGRALALGSPIYAAQIADLTDEQNTAVERLQQEGKTVSVLVDELNRSALGLLALRDELRSDARAAALRLQELGVRAVMLTGDNQLTGQALAAQLGMECVAELLPQDKLNQIRLFKEQERVAMVGDGINDAPALALADVGIAMSGGTDVAMETANAAIMNGRVMDVAHLISLSRATMANIRQNVTVALALKALFLVTTITGVTGLWVAVLADTGATALVTLNALRLLRFKAKKEEQ